MSNPINTPHQSTPQIPVVFAPIPLATGDTLPDADGSQRTVTAATLLLSLDGTSHTVEVALEHKFGGWWAPTKNTIQTASSRQQVADNRQ